MATETSPGKPQWAIEMQRAQALALQAKQARDNALQQLRCKAIESGGVRCTRDLGHQGEHRVKREDLP